MPEDTTQVTETTQTKPVVELQQQGDEMVSMTVLEKLLSVFKKDEAKPTEQQAEPKQEDIDARVKEEVARILGDAIPKAKKEKQAELDRQKAELDKQKQDAELKAELDKVDESYREFVKFQAQAQGKTIDAFLEENNQYKQKTIPMGSNVNATKGIQLEGANKEIYANLKRNGVI